jgi:hypothetical protein
MLLLLSRSALVTNIFQANFLGLRRFALAGKPFTGQANRIQEMGKFLEMIQIFWQVRHRLRYSIVR